MSTELKYTAAYTVPSSRLDAKCRFTADGFMALAQDAAASHYGSGGLSIPHLQRKGLTWVVTRQHFEISEYPLWLDELTVSTWAKPARGPFCYRDYTCAYRPNGKKHSVDSALAGTANAESDGTPFMRGTSCWMVLSLKDGRPIRPDGSLFGTLPFCEEDAVPSIFPKIRTPAQWDEEIPIVPVFTDTDLNGHVNNLNYIRWILSNVPQSVREGRLVSVLDTCFIASARFGDILLCRTAGTRQDDGSAECVHLLIRQQDGAEIFRAKSVWKDERELSRELRLD